VNQAAVSGVGCVVLNDGISRVIGMDIVTIVGAVAAVASTASFVPQAVKIIRTRDTGSISVGMYGITVVGFALWVSYGVLLGGWPIIASNSICLILSAFILVMKLLPRHEKEAIADVIEPIIGE
jgi:MtN3 and saliva related transmembrane protein